MIRPVVRLPDHVLKVRAADVDPTSPDVVALAADLIETMRASPACVGLAATQIAVPMRVFAMDLTGHPKARSCAGLVVVVNPVVVAAGERAVGREGCMSVPDLTGDVLRPKTVTVRGAVPGTGADVEIEADALEARCLLHEIDHLDGLLFIDRVQHAHQLHPRKRYA
ncbi:MAG: peptide deformylase [Mycobacteriales bacterium]